MRGLERRIAAGLSPDVRSVASLFISRWDKATMDKLPANSAGSSGHRRRRSGLRGLSRSPGLRSLAAPRKLRGAAATPLVCEHGTKDPRAPDTLYIGALAAPNTVNTMPEETLLDFADHGEVGGVLRRDGGAASETLSAIAKAGVDLGRWRGTFNRKAPSLRQILERSSEGDRDKVPGASVTNRRSCYERYDDPWCREWKAFKRIMKCEGFAAAQLFAGDPGRGERFSVEAAAFSSTIPRTGSPTRRCALVLSLARARGSATGRHVPGEKINVNENRAVLHVGRLHVSDLVARRVKFGCGGCWATLFRRCWREEVSMPNSSEPLHHLLDTAEGRRLAASKAGVPWRKWGPYLCERQWGTVREDYSADGTPGTISRMITPAAAPIAGVRTACRLLRRPPCAVSSRSRSGTAAIRS